MREDNQEAGMRLRRWIEAGMARSRIHHLSELASQAHVTRTTLYSWFNGTLAPSPGALSRVAHALGASAADATLAWEGKEPLPDTTEAALSVVGVQLNINAELMADLLGRLDVLTVIEARTATDHSDLVAAIRGLSEAVTQDRQEASQDRETLMVALGDIASRLGPPDRAKGVSRGARATGH